MHEQRFEYSRSTRGLLERQGLQLPGDAPQQVPPGVPQPHRRVPPRPDSLRFTLLFRGFHPAEAGLWGWRRRSRTAVVSARRANRSWGPASVRPGRPTSAGGASRLRQAADYGGTTEAELIRQAVDHLATNSTRGNNIAGASASIGEHTRRGCCPYLGAQGVPPAGLARGGPGVAAVAVLPSPFRRGAGGEASIAPSPLPSARSASARRAA